MSTFLIITVAILWVGLKAYKGVRKTFADPEGTTVEPQQTDSPRPAFETLFDDDEADGMQQSPYGYEAYDEAGTFEEEEKAAGYYTYESTSAEEPYEAANPAKSEEPRRQAQAPRMAAMVADEPDEDAGQAFDLRQAIIYQTILHNKYNTALSLS